MHVSFDASIKVKKNAIGGYESHLNRKDYHDNGIEINHSNEDINKDLITTNITWYPDDEYGDTFNDRYKKRLGDYNSVNKDGELRKMRSDAVTIRPLIIQPSADAFEGKTHDEKCEMMKKFTEDALPFIYDNFGGTENVMGVFLHMDETNPHAHIPVMPMTEDGRLNQTAFFKNPKHLRELHKSFRMHMRECGWDVELENKYESPRHHKQNEYKANAELIEKERLEFTKKVRMLKDDATIQKQAIDELKQEDTLIGQQNKQMQQDLYFRKALLEAREKELDERENELKERNRNLDIEVSERADVEARRKLGEELKRIVRTFVENVEKTTNVEKTKAYMCMMLQKSLVFTGVISPDYVSDVRNNYLATQMNEEEVPEQQKINVTPRPPMPPKPLSMPPTNGKLHVKKRDGGLER